MYSKVFYTDFSIPARFGAYERGPFVWIRPKYKDDKGLFEHEMTHVKQFWKSPLFHTLRYAFSKKYRFACEVEAYKVQMQYDPINIDIYAGFLVNNYGLGIDFNTAQAALKN